MLTSACCKQSLTLQGILHPWQQFHLWPFWRSFLFLAACPWFFFLVFFWGGFFGGGGESVQGRLGSWTNKCWGKKVYNISSLTLVICIPLPEASKYAHIHLRVLPWYLGEKTGRWWYLVCIQPINKQIKQLSCRSTTIIYRLLNHTW